jgi:hypothetical protein
VGAQTLPHDGRLSRSRETKPTTFETLTTTSEDEVEDAQDRWGYEYERIAG